MPLLMLTPAGHVTKALRYDDAYTSRVTLMPRFFATPDVISRFSLPLAPAVCSIFAAAGLPPLLPRYISRLFFDAGYYAPLCR